MSVRNRLEKLEAANNNGAPVIIWCEPHETEDQASARWSAERGGLLPEHGGRPPIFVCWQPPQA